MSLNSSGFRRRRHKAFEALLQSGYRYASALVPEERDARDLVHDAWVKLSPRYGMDPDKPLLFRTIRHLFIDVLRRQQRLHLIEYDDDYFNQGSLLDQPDVNSANSAFDAGIDLESAMRMLTVPEREALFMSAVEGFTAKEIAALTDRPRGTVLSMLYRTRVKLRATLEDEHGVSSAAVSDANENRRRK